jgi:predicted P-loop ATPase
MTAALDPLAKLSRWVLWEVQERGGKPTKIPITINGYLAAVDDPTTWSTRAQVEEVARNRPNGSRGGIGTVLGDVGRYFLAGIDLDTCRHSDGTFEPWAQEVIARFDSYTEISPSETGAKTFFLIGVDDIPAIRQAMGTQHSRRWSRPGTVHPPAIELHISNRYFTVTDKLIPATPDRLRRVAVDCILWLIHQAAPAFAGKATPGNGDHSRSARALAAGGKLVRAGATFEQMCEGLRNHAEPEIRAWVREKGDTYGGRELRRIWEKVQEPPPEDEPTGWEEPQADAEPWPDMDAEWLCDKLRVFPESLGWRNGRDPPPQPTPTSDPPPEDVVPTPDPTAPSAPDELRQLRIDIGKLSAESTPEDINAILDRIAGGVPDEITREWLFKTLKAQAGTSVTAMRTRVEQAIKAAGRQRQWVRAPDWRDLLACDRYGTPLATASNVLIALRQAPEWKGVLALDQFHQRSFFVKQPPWPTTRTMPKPFEDADEARCLVWMQENGMPACRMEAVHQALAVVIDDRPFHPIRDFLDARRWDGKPRLATWLTVYLGVEPIENYTGPIGTCWMISAVARIYQPGCPAKYCIILEGPQDLGKSTALEILAGEYYTDDIAELGTKDASMQVGNAWIVELSELASVHKARVEATKAFMSRKTDHFRKPFGRHVIDQERQSVLAATVNPDDGEYLPDQTGNVRFWPVFCTAIDLESLRRDRDQLWAEAVHRYKNGEKWHIEDEDALTIAREQQEARTHVDSWTDIVAQYLRDNAYRHAVTTTHILSKVLFIHSKDHDKPKQSRIAIIMVRVLGWRRRKIGSRRWFVHPDFPDTDYPEET